MISFDQVLLLEEKVESAVKKIEQLNAENAALRRKCAELSNALSAKSEQFSSFESNQSKIEEGILKALSRLNAVENVVLTASSTQSPSEISPVENNPVQHVDTSSSSEASLSDSSESNSLSVNNNNAPEVGFEFGETDSNISSADTPVANQDFSGQLPSDSASDSSQPMFDIF